MPRFGAQRATLPPARYARGCSWLFRTVFFASLRALGAGRNRESAALRTWVTCKRLTQSDAHRRDAELPEQLSRFFFPEVRRVRVPGTDYGRASGANAASRSKRSRIRRHAACDFLSTLPLECAIALRWPAKIDRRPLKASVVAVQYHEGRRPWRFASLTDPRDWVTKATMKMTTLNLPRHLPAWMLRVRRNGKKLALYFPSILRSPSNWRSRSQCHPRA